MLPISYASLYFPGSYYGTISNQNGNFSITLPSCFTENEMVISCLGYESDTFDISLITEPLIISLKEHINQLDEVMVMSDDAVYKLLKSAYDKIPVNYPTTNTAYKGFYRETSSDNNNNYISFGEAFIETVRGSVNLKKDRGQIKIVKSRGGYLPGKDSISNIRFYGGVFQATTDFVQQRIDFIKPTQYTNYSFLISKHSNFYKVLFQDTKKKNGYSGYFLIDTLTMAYTEAKYNRVSNQNDIRYKRHECERFDKFVSVNGKYYLKYRNQHTSGLDKLSNNIIYHFDEYLTSDIYPSAQTTIPEIQQVSYGDIFIDLGRNYDENFWDGYNIIDRDSMLNIDYSIASDVVKVLKKDEKVTFSFKDVVSRMSVSYGVNYRSLSIKSGAYQLDLPLISQKYSNHFENTSLWSLMYNIGFYFQPYLSAYWSSSLSWENKNINSDYLLGIQYKRKINRFGSPYYATLSTGCGLSSTQIMMGSFSNTDNFFWGSKTLRSEIVNVYSGIRSLIIKPQITISKQLKGLNALYLSFAYNLSISTTETINMAENNLLGKSAFQKAESVYHYYLYNDSPIPNIGISNSGFIISCGIKLFK